MIETKDWWRLKATHCAMCDVNLFAPLVHQEVNYFTTEARKWLTDLYSFDIILWKETVRILCHVILVWAPFKMSTRNVCNHWFPPSLRRVCPLPGGFPDERVKWFLFRWQQAYTVEHWHIVIESIYNMMSRANRSRQGNIRTESCILNLYIYKNQHAIHEYKLHVLCTIIVKSPILELHSQFKTLYLQILNFKL